VPCRTIRKVNEMKVQYDIDDPFQLIQGTSQDDTFYLIMGHDIHVRGGGGDDTVYVNLYGQYPEPPPLVDHVITDDEWHTWEFDGHELKTKNVEHVIFVE